MTACTPGSAPGPTLDKEYRRTLPFTSKQNNAVVQFFIGAPCTFDSFCNKVRKQVTYIMVLIGNIKLRVVWQLFVDNCVYRNYFRTELQCSADVTRILTQILTTICW